MTLTLDDVRNMKFRIARRSGYEVLDVDQFVDRVEEAFAQLTEENEQLKRQVADLTEAAEAAEAARAKAEEAAARQPEAAVQAQPAAPAAPPAESAAVGADGERIVVTTSDQASPAVVRLVQLATEQAEHLVEEAKEESSTIIADAKREAGTITSEARSQAEHLESEARLNADRLRNEAQGRAKAFEEELQNRRQETFAAMEIERDNMRESVEKLRRFEKSYRANLTAHLEAQIKGLAGEEFEPGDVPPLMNKSADEDYQGSHRAERQQSGSSQGAAAGSSETPRLDALLGGGSSQSD